MGVLGGQESCCQVPSPCTVAFCPFSSPFSLWGTSAQLLPGSVPRFFLREMGVVTCNCQVGWVSMEHTAGAFPVTGSNKSGDPEGREPAGTGGVQVETHHSHRDGMGQQMGN